MRKRRRFSVPYIDCGSLGVHGRPGGELEPELARVRQGGELPVEGELPLIEGAAEQRQELAPGAEQKKPWSRTLD
jgi:hypothetical protein